MTNAQKLMKEQTLVKHYAGSRSYGTNLPTSDIDFRGIFCADPINIRTPFFPVRECEDLDEEDTKLYELTHFMKLCLDCNPNIIETLWTDEGDIVTTSPAYQLLRDNRSKLLSKKIVHTFSGYAFSQLKRIKGHNKWINNPCPVEPPRQIEYMSLVQDFTDDRVFKASREDMMGWREDHRLVPYGGDVYGMYKAVGYQLFSDDFTLNTLFDGDRREMGNPLRIVKFNNEQYLQSRTTHSQYWQWKQNRNEMRGSLEEQFGYDTKHAMHLIRLLRMSSEIIETGQVIVKRPDAAELLSIRNGAWSYEELIEYADKVDAHTKEVLLPKCTLPNKPDLMFAAQLLMQAQDLVWKK